MRHSWKPVKAKTSQTQNHEQTTQKQTAQTTTNHNTKHTCFLFCVLFCMLWSLLTYKGACGIVGNKKKQNNTRTENEHTPQQTTNNNKHIHVFLYRVLLCLLCSSLTCKGTCSIFENKKKQHKTITEPWTNNTKHKQHKQQQTTTKSIRVLFCFVFCYVCYARY